MPLLELEPGALLVPVKRTDHESRLLADRHYSRQTVGAREFMGNGRTLVLRDQAGLVVFGWLYPRPGSHVEPGVGCAIFRNEGRVRSSSLILEAERLAQARWPGLEGFWTYVRPEAVRSANPGYCFKCAGWRYCGRSGRGYHLLRKPGELAGRLP